MKILTPEEIKDLDRKVKENAKAIDDGVFFPKAEFDDLLASHEELRAHNEANTQVIAQIENQSWINSEASIKKDIEIEKLRQLLNEAREVFESISLASHSDMRTKDTDFHNRLASDFLTRLDQEMKG